MTCPTYAEHLAHLVRMASIPGARDHAWHRAKEMAADPSGLWPGIDAALKAEMLRIRSSTAPVQPGR